MIRNLKVLVAAAMALAAFGVIGVAGAQAAEFHCSVESCVGNLKQDGTGKTAHHVFIVENEKATESASFTCNALTGKGAVPVKKTTTEVEVGGAVGAANALVYKECLVNGTAATTIDMNGCKYNMTAAGNFSITGCTNAAKQIEVTITGCTFDIPEQGPLAGITYHTIGTTPNRELTAEFNIKGIKVTATGTKAACFINPEQTLTATYTTGNTIATAETVGGVMAEGWWE
jgi:hypothetical protein